MNTRIIRPVQIVCSDPEEFREKAVGWDFDHCQLVRGTYRSSVLLLETANLQLSLSKHSIGTMERGAPPRNASTITLPILNNSPLYFCGDRLKKDRCPVMLPGEEFEAFCQGANQFINIVFNRTLLDRESYKMTGLPFAALTRQKQLAIHSRDQQILAKKLIMVMHILIKDGLPSAQARQLEQKIMKELLLVSQPPDNRERCHELPDRRKAAWKAEQIIRKNLQQQLDTYQLSKLVRCAVRTLHLGFKERYGLTPARYGRILALHAARKELYNLAPGKTIADVALDWGFQHFGRFSHYYKELFDELPRQTVEQARMHFGISAARLCVTAPGY